MGEKQKKALNEERIREATKELNLCKKNVTEAIKTKNFDLINIARRELRHARVNFSKSNVIKIEMAKKILDEKEESRANFRLQKKELMKDVKYMVKKPTTKQSLLTPYNKSNYMWVNSNQLEHLVPKKLLKFPKRHMLGPKKCTKK